MFDVRRGEIYMIKLKTFGSFTVGNDITSVQEGAWRSEKLEKLFVYLAMNRNRGVCIEDISEAIWQVEEETDNPVGALKNLAYRLIIATVYCAVFICTICSFTVFTKYSCV